MDKKTKHKKAAVKVYHGYGHTHDLVIFGHVFKKLPATRRPFRNNILANIIHLVKLFFVRPLPGMKVQLKWGNRIFETTSEHDGFFHFEWQSDDEVSAGWHELNVTCVDEGVEVAKGTGKLFVPHSTQYGFISDIDDTVLVSHSATIYKRLKVLLTKHPRSRKTFGDVVKHYQLLSQAHTTPGVPNPFFYVSSSEWNLYDDLNEFFKHNKLPQGVFLLNEIKRWNQFFKTGKTKHEGKMQRIMRILDTFPIQKFVLLGDNSQADPEIYTALAAKYPGRIFAIYINNVRLEKEAATKQLLATAEKKGVFICLYKNNYSAIEYSKAIGLI